MASTYRVIKSQDYVTMANYHLRDKRLSMAAKGLMSVLLADEDGEAYTIAELAERGPEGRDAVRSALRRLEEAGYIQRRQTHDGDGRFSGNEYLIYESPPPLPENPTTGKPMTDKPLTGNPTAAELVLNHGSGEASGEALSTSPGKEEDIGKPPTNPPAKRRGEGPKWKPERFQAFWRFYKDRTGRGESKQAAVRAWDKLRPSDELIAEIGRALVRQLQTDEWKRGIGIPYASTYLNGRRWEDETALQRTPPAREAPEGEREAPELWD